MQNSDSVGVRSKTIIVVSGGVLIFFSLVLLYFAAYMVFIGPKFILVIMAELKSVIDVNVIVLFYYCAALVLSMFSMIFLVLGVRLIKSIDVFTSDTIPAKDYDLITKAIDAGDENAINLYIKLRSLSGWVGACTKLGLTGLSLATIFLTIFFTIIGMVNAKFYDLAQLMLGAFIGSFVQKKNEVSAGDLNKKNVGGGDAEKK